MSGTTLPGAPLAQKNFWTRIPLSYRIIAAVGLGILVGILLGQAGIPPPAYDATGLPAGLSVDHVAGEITGTPTETGEFKVALTATNIAGTGQSDIVLNVQPKQTPVVAGSNKIMAFSGAPFTYKISAHVSEIVPWQVTLLLKIYELSKLFIDLLKALATPLIFFAVIDALVRTHIPPRKGFKLICISAVNAVMAIAIGLFLANTLRGGDTWRGKLDDIKKKVDLASHDAAEKSAQKLAEDMKKAKEISLDPVKQFDKYMIKNFVDPFQSNNIISVVGIAILAGAALRKLRNRAAAGTEHGLKTIEDGVQTLFQMFTVMLGWIIEIIPLAIFGIVSKVVGDTGVDLFKPLGYFLGIVLLGLFLYTFVYYSIVLYTVGRVSPLAFFKGASEAIITSLSCGSSLATLPVTLRCLKEKLRISDANARLSACVGTNLNHAGIILYEASATIFVAQALGMELTLTQQIVVAFASVMAGMGIAGVPEAGLITLQLVLTAGGIPDDKIIKVIPLLFTVDWIIGRNRAMTNVLSDMTVATLLERLDPPELPVQEVV